MDSPCSVDDDMVDEDNDDVDGGDDDDDDCDDGGGVDDDGVADVKTRRMQNIFFFSNLPQNPLKSSPAFWGVETIIKQFVASKKCCYYCYH